MTFTSSILRLINSISGTISCVFLSVTFIVYCSVPELNNLHGKIIISNVATIFLSTAYILIVYNFSHLFSYLVCKIFGFVGYFFTICMFSWMTIMSFDLCWTFIRAKMPRKSSTNLKYMIYSSVAWGWGFVLTMTIMLADTLMEETSYLPMPEVGVSKCFLGDTAQGVYFHLPVLLLMLVNGIFFVITTSTLYRYHRGSRIKSISVIIFIILMSFLTCLATIMLPSINSK